MAESTSTLWTELQRVSKPPKASSFSFSSKLQTVRALCLAETGRFVNRAKPACQRGPFEVERLTYYSSAYIRAAAAKPVAVAEIHWSGP